MHRFTEFKKWFDQKSGRWLVLPVLIAVTVALLTTWTYPSAGELVVPKPLPVTVKTPLSPVAEQKPTADDAVMNRLDERVKELESAQKALYLSWLDGQRKTVDWWLTFLGVVAAVLALGGALIPFLMGRKDRELLDADHKLVKRLLADAHAAMGELKALRDGAEEMSSDMENGLQAANLVMASLKNIEGQTGAGPRTRDKESEQKLDRANDELKGKAEKDFSANEHYVRGVSLFADGNFQGALSSFEAALLSAVNAPSIDQVKYLFAKARALDSLGKSDETIKVCDEIDRRFGSDASPQIRAQVAKGLVNKGIMLGQQGQFEVAIEVCDDIDRRFGSDSSPGIREQVVTGLRNKGVMLGMQVKSEEAIKLYDEMDRRFGSDVAPGVRGQVVWGLVNKGGMLGQQEQFAETLKVYDEIERRFGSDSSLEVREQVAKGLNGLGFSQIMRAKEHWLDEPLRQSRLSSAATVLARATAMCGPDDRAMIQGNLGYALYLAGQVQAARSPTFECLKLGGQKALDDQRGDVKLHRVEPEDVAYEKLLDELWASLPPSNAC